MGLLDDIWGGVKAIGGAVVSSLPSAIPAGLEYLASREQSRAAKEISKATSGVAGRLYAAQRAARDPGLGFQLQGPMQGPIVGLQAPMNGGGGVNILDTILGSAPYVQRMMSAAAGEGAMAGVGAAGAREGVAGALMVPGMMGVCPTRRLGGIPIAANLASFYTEAGNPRGTVATIANGRITYWSNRGVPVIFSRDATMCKRMRKIAGKAHSAAGGSSRKR